MKTNSVLGRTWGKGTTEQKWGGRIRDLRLEPLEERALLSASPLGDLNEVAAAYSEFQLTADTNLLEVTDLTAESLRHAIQQAAQTTTDDVLVVRTTAAANTIALGDAALVFDWDADAYGSVTLVGWGEDILTLSSTSGTVAEVTTGEVNFGGVSFLALEGAGDSFTTDALVAVSGDAQVSYSRSLWSVENAAQSHGDLGGAYTGYATGLSSHSYSTTVNISGTEYAFITGLTQADYQQLQTWAFSGTLTGDFIDAEKSHETDTDDDLCWAGTSANVLWYTEWANAKLKDDNGNALFTSEDGVFRYFRDHFSNDGGDAYYAFEWFLTGEYTAPTTAGWSQVTTPGGGFYADKTVSNAWGYFTVTGDQGPTKVASMETYLQDGYGVGMGIEYLDDQGEWTGGHAVTLWGYRYDTSKTGSEYYTGVFITDSDDNGWGNPSGTSALDKLNAVTMTWDATLKEYHLASYDEDAYWLDYSYLAPMDSFLGTIDVETSNGGTITPSKVSVGDTFSISGIPVSSIGGKDAGTCTVKIYASADTTISATSDTLLKTINVENVTGDLSTTVSATLDSKDLTVGSSYTIGWILEVTNNESTKTTGYCTTPVQILEARPAAPVISATATGFNSVKVTLSEVEGITRYVLHYSTDQAFSSASVQAIVVGENEITGLSAGTTYYFRAVSVLNDDVRSLESTAVSVSTYSRGMRTFLGGSITPTAIPLGDTFSISDVLVSNIGSETFSSYNVLFYASTDTTINSSDIHLATVTGQNLVGGASNTLSATLSSSSLALGVDYYIGWILEASGNLSTETTAYCPTMVGILSARPAAPSISAVAIGANQIDVTLGTSDTATGYAIEYSQSATFSTYTSVDAVVGVNHLTGLDMGTTYYFRAKAILDEAVSSRYTEVISATTKTLTFSTQNGGEVSSTNVKYGTTFTLSKVPVSNTGEVETGSYEIWYYASKDLRIEATDILLKKVSMESMAAGTTGSFSVELETTLLNSGMQYCIGWVLVLDQNKSTSTSGYCIDTVMITGDILDAPALSVGENAIGPKAIDVTLVGVENAESYVIQYSTSTDFETWETVEAPAAGVYTIPNLTPETTYFVRAYSVGTKGYENSAYSSVLTVKTDVPLFDVQASNGGTLFSTNVLFGDFINLDGIPVKNDSDATTPTCMAYFYASLDTTLNKETDIYLTSWEVGKLAPYATDTFGAALNTAELESGQSYYIFWELVVANEKYVGNNIAYCPTKVTIDKFSLETFEITDADAEYRAFDTLWTTRTPSTATVTYQWYRGETNTTITTLIEGATSASYKLQRADVGCYVKCVMTGIEDFGGSMEAILTNAVLEAQEFDLATSATGVSLSATSLLYGDSFTVSNVPIANAGGTLPTGQYTIRYYASRDNNITTSDTLLGAFAMDSLELEESILDTRTFSTSAIAPGTSYYIGWILTGSGEYETANNTAYASTKLTVNKIQLSTPTLELVEEEALSITLHLSTVDNASGYVIQYSTDEAFTTYESLSARSGDNALDLLSGTQYYFRAYAVGAGVYKNSGTTPILAAATKIYAPDLAAYTNSAISASPLSVGNTFTVSNIRVSNIGNQEVETYTIQFYASEDEVFDNTDILLETVDGILLGTVTKGPISALPPGSTASFSQTLNSILLEGGSTYYIGWHLSTPGERNLENNWGYCTQTLTTEEKLESDVTPILVTTASDIDSHLMPTNTTQINEWTSFALELWSTEGAGNTSVTLRYDTTLFTLQGWNSPDNIAITSQEMPDGEEGWATILLAATVDAQYHGTSSKVLMMQLDFTPTGSNGIAANAAPNAQWCTVDGTVLDTTAYANPYDMDDSGIVNMNDLILFMGYFNSSVSENPAASLADYDRNGEVNLNDLILLMKNYDTSLETTDALEVIYPKAVALSLLSTSMEIPQISPKAASKTAVLEEIYQGDLWKYENGIQNGTENDDLAAETLSMLDSGDEDRFHWEDFLTETRSYEELDITLD